MPAVPADLSIKARWIVPMTGRDEVLDHHTLVMRDGRILDVLPTAAASERYEPRVALERPVHLVMPGLVNALTHIGSRGAAPETRNSRPSGAAVHREHAESRHHLLLRHRLLSRAMRRSSPLRRGCAR